MWNWKYKQIFILFIVLVLFLQCGCAKKKKKAKKPKLKYPATILQASNRTHFAIAPTCNARIEILKKNETEDLELGLGKNTLYWDIFRERWEDFPYPPVSPEQIKKEKKYYKYLSNTMLECSTLTRLFYVFNKVVSNLYTILRRLCVEKT